MRSRRIARSAGHQKGSKIPEGCRPLEGSQRHPAPTAQLLGPADPNETISVTCVLRRRLDGPPVPAMNYFAVTPLSQRGRLPEAEFAAKYGAAQSDIDQVAAFARAHGLTVVETHAARRTLIVSGTVAQMEEAFAVTLGRYQVNHPGGRRSGQPETEIYRGRDGFIHLPNELAGVLVGVFGLDNRRVMKRNGGDPPHTTPLTTEKITQLYNFPKNSAKGQTIAIVSVLGGYRVEDIMATFPQGIPTITPVPVDATNIHESSHAPSTPLIDPETTQDICIAGLAAPGAHIAVFFISGSEPSWVNMIGMAIHPGPRGEPYCSVLSSSYYISDGDDASTLQAEGISQNLLTVTNQAFEDAALQGLTICVASGDYGSSSFVGGIDGDGANGYWGLRDGLAHVQYPASSPWVLAVGGTSTGSVREFPVSGTADEYVWNDPLPWDPAYGDRDNISYAPAAGWGTTGGGVSDHFDLPRYQRNAGVPYSINPDHRVGRGVPDVAANASAHSGYSGLWFNDQPFAGAGTSASAPLWAGLIAVINAALGKNVGLCQSGGLSTRFDCVPGHSPP